MHYRSTVSFVLAVMLVGEFRITKFWCDPYAPWLKWTRVWFDDHEYTTIRTVRIWLTFMGPLLVLGATPIGVYEWRYRLLPVEYLDAYIKLRFDTHKSVATQAKGAQVVVLHEPLGELMRLVFQFM